MSKKPQDPKCAECGEELGDSPHGPVDWLVCDECYKWIVEQEGRYERRVERDDDKDG